MHPKCFFCDKAFWAKPVTDNHWIESRVDISMSVMLLYEALRIFMYDLCTYYPFLSLCSTSRITKSNAIFRQFYFLCAYGLTEEKILGGIACLHLDKMQDAKKKTLNRVGCFAQKAARGETGLDFQRTCRFILAKQGNDNFITI